MPGVNVSDVSASETVWVPPRRREIIRWPLAGIKPFDRFLTRAMAMPASRYVVSVSGAEHVSHELDPFVFAANHNNYREALYLPAILMLIRRGHLFHFLADWNVRLYPGINFLFRRFDVITVTSKPCQYKLLNRLMPLCAEPEGALRRARRVLSEGKSIGIFPEGIINPRSDHLLSGHSGAAFLSLSESVPVIPVGITEVDKADRTGRPGVVVRIGAPLDPKSAGYTTSSRAAVAEWHATIMNRIAELSGKSWSPETRRRRPNKP